MSLFHKLQDVYFDAVNLSEELTQIPPHCDCADAETHLAGRCSCGVAHSGEQRAEDADTGCLFQLRKLRESINWFEEDLRASRNKFRSENRTFAVEGRLSLVVSVIDNLKRTIGEIENDLAEFRLSCANEALQSVQGKSKELEHCAQELNKVL